MNRGIKTWMALAGLALAGAGSIRAQNPIPPSPPRIAPPRQPAPTDAPPPTAPIPQQTANAAASRDGASPSATSAGGDYILSKSDIVEMSVFHEPDLTTQARIANDGSVQFPLIGELKIGGMAVRDAREMIRKRYNADYLVEPQVYLNVTAFADRKFTILGQVTKPGTYEFTGGEHLSLLEAVGMAGGFTRLADQSGVSIKRTTNGTEQTLKVNTKKLTAKGGKAFEVVPGDVVTVGESWF